MNSFGNYIHGLKKANKALFQSKKINISTQSFEKELEKAYNQGFADSNGEYDKKSIFDKIFGMSLFDTTSKIVHSKIEIEETMNDIKKK